MSTNNPDPIDKWLNDTLGHEGDPIDAWLDKTLPPQEGPGLTDMLKSMVDATPGGMQDIAMLAGKLGFSAGPAVGKFTATADQIARMITGGEGPLDIYKASQGDPEALRELGLLAPFAAGAMETAIAGPAEGVLGMPSAMLGNKELPTQKWADWVNRVSLGAKTRAEQMALEAGVSEEDIANAYTLGNFVGFTAPIVTSVKAASLILRTGQSVGAAMASGEYITDFTAGLIYGGLLQPGDAKERLLHMGEEAAAFGVMRTFIMAGAPVKAMRHDRSRRLDVSGRLARRLERAQNGEAVEFDEIADIAGDRGVLQILQEEQFIAQSLAAQELVMRHEYDAALVQAIRDVAGANWTGGVVRSVGHQWDDVVSRMNRLKEQFPALKFDAVKRVVEVREVPVEEIIASTYRGKSGKWYEGITHADAMEAARAADDIQPWMYHGSPMSSDVGFKTSHGRIVDREEAAKLSKDQVIGDELLGGSQRHSSDILEPGSKDRIVRTGATKDQEITHYDIFFGVKGLSNKQRAQLKSEGRFAGQVLLYGSDEVEYVGKASRPDWIRVKTPDGSVKQVKESSISDLPFSKEDIDGPQYDALYQEFRKYIDEKQAQVVEARGGLTEYDLIEAVRKGEITLDPQARRAFDHTALIYPEELGMGPEDLAKLGTPEEMTQLLGQTGTQNILKLDPEPAMSFERIFDSWANEAGIPADAVDYISTRTAFAERFRREVWDSLDDRDKDIWNSIRQEYETLLEKSDHDFSVEQLAAVKGFYAERLPDGRIALREINTGLTFSFGSDAVARAALKKMTMPEKDLPGLLQTGGHGIVDWSRGLPKSESIQFEEVVTTLEAKLDVHKNAFRNNRDWLIAVEETTGLPVWSKGFDPIQKGYTQMLADYEPYAKEIGDLWKGIDIQRRYKIAEVWVDAEQNGLSLNQLAKRMKAEGFSPKEINALRRARAVFDDLFERSGIDPSRYIPMYYTRVRPYVNKHGVPQSVREMFGENIRPSELEFWGEFTRTGDLAVMEMDPALVMHKYARTMFFQQHVKQHWDELARLTGTAGKGGMKPMRIRDLPEGLKQRAIKNALPGSTLDSPALPEAVLKTLSEYLMIVRGQTAHVTERSRAFTRRFMRAFNIDADDRVLEELTNSWISMQYGAAMGLRPMTVARNMTQTVWLLYPRLGSRTMGRGLEMSMTREGFDEVVRVGAVPLQEAGVPAGDVVLENIMQRSPRALDGNLLSMGLAGGIRSLMRAGKIGKDLSKKSLVYYASSDHASRAWSYWAQKLHTDEWLKKMEAGKISWEKFEEEGLAFFPQVAKTKFREFYDHTGREEALQFIGRLGSDETNFIYGLGAQPAWMQKTAGRLVGMFGTWPLWAIESYMRPLRYATPLQAGKFYMRTAAVAAGFVNMGMQAGIDIWSWIAPTSTAGWSGGPAVDHLINAKRVIDAPLDQKRAAFGRLVKDMTRLAIPGQVFGMEVMRSANLAQHNPGLAALSMMMGKPSDLEHIGLDYLYNPDNHMAEPIISEENKLEMEQMEYPNWLESIHFNQTAPKPEEE